MFEYVITEQLSKEHVAFRLQTHLFVPTKNMPVSTLFGVCLH